MHKTNLTPEDKKAIAAEYQTGNVSQDELAISYGVSSTTIRRILYTFGLCQFNSEVSPLEREFLNAIKNKGITDLSYLLKVLNKGCSA